MSGRPISDAEQGSRWEDASLDSADCKCFFFGFFLLNPFQSKSCEIRCHRWAPRFLLPMTLQHAIGDDRRESFREWSGDIPIGMSSNLNGTEDEMGGEWRTHFAELQATNSVLNRLQNHPFSGQCFLIDIQLSLYSSHKKSHGNRCQFVPMDTYRRMLFSILIGYCSLIGS